MRLERDKKTSKKGGWEEGGREGGRKDYIERERFVPAAGVAGAVAAASPVPPLGPAAVVVAVQ